MLINNMLIIASELGRNLADEELDFEVMNAGVIWDEDRAFVRDVYKLIENYRQNFTED